jgi:hypothetical protein
VHYVRDVTGRFPERPYYEAAELNELCEGIVQPFLVRKHGSCLYPIRTDDLALLLELQDVILDSYCDLSAYGANTEGASVFAPDEPARVSISKNLSENPRRENRYRSTLAHEFGHVLLHGPLFCAAKTGDLFETSSSSRAATCKRQTIERAPWSDWLEWQAGFVSGALLMPASAVRNLAKDILMGQATPPLASPAAEALIEDVRRAFQVSREAAEVRLQQLGLVQPRETRNLL